MPRRGIPELPMTKTKANSLMLLLLALIALLLIVRVWASARAVSVIGPIQIRVASNGNIYIATAKTLYIHSREGALLERIPLSWFGIEYVMGDFWVYRNGDILLRREVAKRHSISREAQIYARVGTGEEDRLGNGESVLQRCDTLFFECRPLGPGKDLFDKITTFHVFANADESRFYLADTEGHRILLMDDRGDIINRSGENFHFPNQILLDDDGLLYVADTNNHRIIGLSTEESAFGIAKKQFPISNPKKKSRRKPTWPMSLAHTPDREWWVIDAEHGMRDGTLMAYSDAGRFKKIIPLPRGADPVCFGVLSDRVLLGDPTLMRVYTLSFKGELLGDFGSLPFKHDLSDLIREKRAYDLIALSSLGVLLVLLISALLLAWLARKQELTSIQAQYRPETVAPATGPFKKHYDYHSIVGLFRIAFGIAFVLLMASTLFLLLIAGALPKFSFSVIPLTLMVYTASALSGLLQMKNTLIEITEQGIVFQGWKRRVEAPWHTVREIKNFKNKYKISTDRGAFVIGLIEPADSVPRGWLDFLKPKRKLFLLELTAEIKARAPHVKEVTPFLLRPF